MRKVMKETMKEAMTMIFIFNNKQFTIYIYKRKKKVTVTYIVPILSVSTYYEPLQEQVHEKQLLCWACQKKERQASPGPQHLAQCPLTVLS
jgi:hypothetical protein